MPIFYKRVDIQINFLMTVFLMVAIFLYLIQLQIIVAIKRNFVNQLGHENQIRAEKLALLSKTKIKKKSNYLIKKY